MNPSCSLIIGSSGFIGSSLCRSFYGSEDFYTISRSSSSADSNHFSLDIEDISGFKKIISDLDSKYQKINIYYLVGPISEDRSVKNPVDLSLKNPGEVLNRSISNLINILEVIREVNCTLLFASTGAIYDSRDNDFFSESDALFPPSPYAAIKYSSEGICLSYLESFNVDVRIARIFSVYGDEMDRFFIFDIVKKLLSSDSKVVLKGSGNQERDYLHVSDVALGLNIIMDKGMPGEIYNLCSGIPYKLTDLTSQIKTYLNLENIDIIWDKEDTKGVRDVWFGSNQKLKNLGFKIDDIHGSKLNSTVNSIKERILAQ